MSQMEKTALCTAAFGKYLALFLTTHTGSILYRGCCPINSLLYTAARRSAFWEPPQVLKTKAPLTFPALFSSKIPECAELGQFRLFVRLPCFFF